MSALGYSEAFPEPEIGKEGYQETCTKEKEKKVVGQDKKEKVKKKTKEEKTKGRSITFMKQSVRSSSAGRSFKITD